MPDDLAIDIAAEDAPRTTECRFIRLAERDRYERDGWTVTPIRGFHCQYSWLATRRAAR